MSAPKPTTQAERLTRIETILEGAFGDGGTVPQMRDDVRAIKNELDADVADLARLKHRGAGILVGVSVTSTAIGAFFSQPIKALFKLLS